MYKYHFYDLKVHFWWPNKCSKHQVQLSTPCPLSNCTELYCTVLYFYCTVLSQQFYHYWVLTILLVSDLNPVYLSDKILECGEIIILSTSWIFTKIYGFSMSCISLVSVITLPPLGLIVTTITLVDGVTVFTYQVSL